MSRRYQLFATLQAIAEAFHQGAVQVNVTDPFTGLPLRVRREEFKVDQWFGLATRSSDALWANQRIARFNDMLSMVAARPETGNRMVPHYQTRLWAAMARNGRLRTASVPGMASSGYHSPRDIVERSIQYEAAFNRAIGKRMKQLGVPDESIGIQKWPGVNETPFTQFPSTQVGGNRNPRIFPGLRGIALDHGILDENHPMMKNVPSWARSAVKDRIDAAIVHEHIESKLKPPRYLSGIAAAKWAHEQAIRLAPNTKLPITDRARAILREYRRAMDLE